MAARTTSTRRAVAGAVRTRLKTALTAEDYVRSVALRNRTDPSLAQQDLRPSPAPTHAGRRVVIAVRQFADLIHAQFVHRGGHSVIDVLDQLQDWSLARQKEKTPADDLGSTADCAREGTPCIQ